MDTSLLHTPYWRLEDLGKSMPESPHAVSMALPLWRHVIGYEEGDPTVCTALRCGYPRFIFNPIVVELCHRFEREHGKPGEQALVFPSTRTAGGCISFLKHHADTDARFCTDPQTGIHAVLFPSDAFPIAKQYWQHYGAIVSSRRALAALNYQGPQAGGHGAKEVLKKRIAAQLYSRPELTYLYPSGMAALTGALRMVQHLHPHKKTVQIGAGYVDLFRIQTLSTPGQHLFADVHKGIDELEQLLQVEPPAAVFCEFPTNPLLQSADLKMIADLLRPYRIPLIVDNTLGTSENIDLSSVADVVVTSLTKYFSGAGDVMAGSLSINPRSVLCSRLNASLTRNYEDLLFDDDALVLEHHSREFHHRMIQINETGLRVCEYLNTHAKVETVLYPAFTDRDNYDALKKPNGGYGGVFTLLLKNAAEATPAFYDALQCCKGPSLGNIFTLVCPYTLMAHYDEQKWAQSIGMHPRHIRVSMGLEPAEELIGRFEAALKSL